MLLLLLLLLKLFALLPLRLFTSKSFLLGPQLLFRFLSPKSFECVPLLLLLSMPLKLFALLLLRFFKSKPFLLGPQLLLLKLMLLLRSLLG